MTVAQHTMSLDLFDALATGGGGAEAARLLVSARRSRTVAFIRLLAAADPDASEPYSVLGELRQHHPVAVNRVLDDPMVGLWVTAALLRHERGEPVGGAGLAHVAAAAAVRADVAVDLKFPGLVSSVLPTLGTLVGPVRGRVRTDHLFWQPFPMLAPAPGLRWTFGGWPAGLLPDGLGLARFVDTAAWAERVAQAWELLTTDHPVLAEELAVMVSALTPLAPSDVGETSATVGDALGCVFLSLGTDAESMAVTLAHELHHAKLTVLMDLFPLFDTDDDTRYYAPWRTDPRPIAGLLHGAYAHLAIASFWRDRRRVAVSPRAHREFARWRAATWLATQTLLDSDALTPLGSRFVDAIGDRVLGWLAEPVPADEQRVARRLLAEHHRTWLSRWT
ncbi:aKG-HExxH-type peptide beta-hydroxylase [Actinokineospora inagensis]|uniref:aKG-HExxH-type peptide beta-hydroxylase n=1 Tax=Actinokineospora inagensis TaxID=103730 RepID=UPI000413365F|nr:HEXXH motif-containing putative peptide modification protein [Actinokineospora inagensis]